MIHRGYKYRLYLTEETERTFREWAGAVRAVYNCALQQKEWFGREVKLGYIEQASELKHLRAEFDWVRAVPQQCLQQALRDLHTAFSRFFSGTSGYPTNRRKFVNDSFRFPGRDASNIRVLNRKWAEVKLPKVGWVRFRQSRSLPKGTVNNATVAWHANGWHISFVVEMDALAPSTEGLPAVAIDRGVTNTLALSTGELLSLPKHTLDALDRRCRKAQRDLSVRKRGSIRYRRARKRVALLKAKAGRVRSHWQHEVTTGLANRHNVLVLEALKVRSMISSASGTQEQPGKGVSQKRGLNRSISNAAWHRFQVLAEYKFKERNGLVLCISPTYTSQTCSECGSVHKASRESQAKFCCVDCGHQDHADINAAMNILRAGTQPAEGRGPRRELTRAA